MMILQGSFDPITVKELEEIKKMRRKAGVSDIWVIPSETAESASFNDRFAMLENALRPYRHLHAIRKTEKSVTLFKAIDEKEAREGKYRLIAYGAREYVQKKGIYLEDTVKHMCNPHRAVHSKGVALTAQKIAAAHHLDSWRAYEMGMLHDITKALPDEENGRIIHSLKPEWDDISPKVWHSFTAGVFMKQEMAWNDKEIIHAIEHHTLGDGHTSFDRILYIADKIEPGRGYDTTKEMKLALHNLKAASECILKESEDYRKKTGR